MVDLIFYSRSMWLTGAVTVGLCVGVSFVLAMLVRRLVPLSVRQAHNELTGYVLAVVSVVYAVLLAFIAVAAWESYSKADDLAVREASLVGDVARDVGALSNPGTVPFLKEMGRYLDQVIDREWPAMGRGASLRRGQGNQVSLADEGWDILFSAHERLAAIPVANAAETAMFAEALKQLNTLYDARRDRLQATGQRLQGVVWGVVLLGGFLTSAFVGLFGMDSQRLQGAMTVCVALSIALVMLLIVAFDRPYQGEIKVSDEMFVRVRSDLTARLNALPAGVGERP